MDKFQSHFSGCSEFVNFDMVVTFRLTVLLPQYTSVYAAESHYYQVVTNTIFFTYCKCDLHFWRLRYQNMSCFPYHREMKKTNIGCHLLVTHIIAMLCLYPMISNTVEK